MENLVECYWDENVQCYCSIKDLEEYGSDEAYYETIIEELKKQPIICYLGKYGQYHPVL